MSFFIFNIINRKNSEFDIYDFKPLFYLQEIIINGIDYYDFETP